MNHHLNNPVRVSLFLLLSILSLNCIKAQASAFEPEAYLKRAFHDVLRRKPTSRELSHWTDKFAEGTTTEDFASAILHSSELNRLELTKIVHRYLRREVTQADLREGFRMIAAGKTFEQIIVYVLCSPEYSFINGNNANTWIEAAYYDVYGRLPEEGEGWDAYALLSKSGRRAVAENLVSSDEYRRRLVRGWYQTYLHREPEAEGWKNWTEALGTGVTDQKAQAGFISSPEYLALPALP